MGILILLSSCDEKMEEMNTNPLALSEISDEYLFTNAIRQSFGKVEDILRFASQYSHIYVTNSEMRAADSYLDFHTQDLYKFMYNQAYINQLRMINEVLIITGEGERRNPVRYAIADIVAVLNYAQITDQWGDIPYFEGAMGSKGILNPPYDRQQEIYHDLIQRLKNSISVLKSADPSVAYPGADPIYQNDLSKWIRFANSLRLRLAMRVRFAEPAFSSQVITDCMADPFIELNDQNFELEHEESDNQELYNPWYDLRKVQNWKMSKKFTDWLKSTSDPRLEIFVDTNSYGEYNGVPNGLTDQAVSQIDWTTYSNPRPGLYSKDMSQYLMCASEVWFLRAEAALFGLSPGDPEVFYRQGIITDMQRWNVPLPVIDNYLSSIAEATLSGDNENKFRQIATQMWIAFVPNFNEAWSNIRRTGYPEIPQRSNPQIYSLGVTNGFLPKRFKYSSAEYLNNNSNVNEAVKTQGPDLIDTPVWWDIRQN
jgi:hypothetical protein